MITVTKTITIHPSVRLTKPQIERFKRLIVKDENIKNACEFSNINYRTFRKALKGNHAIKEEQRDKLTEFCDILENKTRKTA